MRKLSRHGRPRLTVGGAVIAMPVVFVLAGCTHRSPTASVTATGQGLPRSAPATRASVAAVPQPAMQRPTVP